ncbi:restriction endonuclease subunit S [Patescibacteria group bacterium]|nr:restriction endonuclease subunit S [Patescibacteria group bacterium]
MKLVPLNSIFDIEYGNQFDLYKLDVDFDSNINFVSRSSQNLGVICKVAKYNFIEPFPAGLITVTLGGTYLLSSFVQQEEFYTAQNIKVLKPKRTMSFSEKIFYCKAIELNRKKYTSHGREANKTLDTLLVPENAPSKFTVIKIEDVNNTKREPILKEKSELTTKNWKYFELSKLFNIKGSTTTSQLELEEYGEGKYPYVTTQAANNGIEGFYDFYSEDGEVLTVDSAVLGYCAYQERPFSASDHVEKLIPRFEINKYIAMFIVTILNLEQYRYNYGRKCSQNRMKEIKIKLPSKAGTPDFEFMENYIKTLPYSANL